MSAQTGSSARRGECSRPARPAQRFFYSLLRARISLHAKDVLLEPYSGRALGSVTSGALCAVTPAITGRPLYESALVFALGNAGLVRAVHHIRTISVTRCRKDADLRLGDVRAVSRDSMLRLASDV